MSKPSNHLQSQNGLLPYLPVLLAVLIMLPRLISPQFGLMDDGKSVITAQQILGGEWGFPFDTYDARFRPVYWLAFTLVYWLAGAQPFWFFLGNTLLFALTVFCLVRFLLNTGASRLQAGLSGLLFALAPPIVENYYTLSKGEAGQVLFLGLSLLIISRYIRARSRAARMLLILLSAAAVLLAAMCKEISIITPGIAAVWWLARRVALRRQVDRSALAPYRAWFLASAAAAIVYLLLRTTLVMGALQTQGYTSRFVFTVEQVVSGIIRWTGWLVRNFAWLAPLTAGVLLLWIFRRKPSGEKWIFESLTWAAAWIAVFLPWNLMTEYYMLPAALGLAALGGALLVHLLAGLKDRSIWLRGASLLALAITALLFAINCLAGITDARIQLAVDRANRDMMDTLAETAPSGAIVLVNIREVNEYVDQMNWQLPAIYNRPDLQVKPYDPARVGEPGTYFILQPEIRSQPLMTVRLGVVEATQDAWNTGLQADRAALPWLHETAVIGQQFQHLHVDLPRLLCPLMKTRSFCASSSPLVDTRPFSYRWTIYRGELKP